ncbi:MAG: class I SAM-dependent methyltransferase [Candidatus Sedimenticola sp. PURPLELP]
MTDRKNHWEQVYSSKTSTEVSWYQPCPDISLKLIEHSGITPDDPIIDIGGGCSLLVDHLITLGYTNISVLDLARSALDIAIRRLEEQAEKVTWIEADATDFDLAHEIALWHDRAVFHFLTDPADRKAYLQNLKRHLRTGGQLIIAAFAPEGPEKCSGLNIVQYDLDKIQAELGPDYVLHEATAENHVTPSGGQQAFNYFRFEKSV